MSSRSRSGLGRPHERLRVFLEGWSLVKTKRGAVPLAPPQVPGLSTTTGGLGVAHRSGLRLRPRRPKRLLIAAAAMVTAVALSVSVYSKIGHRRDVLMMTRDVMAGEQLRDTDVGLVSLSSDDSLAVAPVGFPVAGQYAKVRMLRGTLLAPGSLQLQPLVDPARAVVALPITSTQVPVGLREGSRLLVTVISSSPAVPVVVVEATVVAVPVFPAGAASGAVSVQVPLSQVATVSSAAKVAISLIDPSVPLPAGVIAG
jgi:hypothetical protein